MSEYESETRFCNIFENFQNKTLKRRIGKPGELCFRSRDTVSVVGQRATLLDIVERSARIKKRCY